MLGLIYLCLCFTVGFTVCSLVWPNLGQRTEKTIWGSCVKLSPIFLQLPAWYLTGTILMTWCTYLLAYLFRSMKSPLVFANGIVIPVAMAFSAVGIVRALILRKEKKIKPFAGLRYAELVFIACTVMLVLLLMWWSFFIREGKLYVGFTIYSDFAPHLGMIRSFSVGNNFPTQYSHFAGEDIKYHFMFQFHVGNLEFLGLPIDYAFNLPSMFSLTFAIFLLYALTVKLTGRRFTGYLACLFFVFRSSDAFFDFIARIPKGQDIWKTLKENMTYIGTTEHEDWGLWNLNVYCNQRHLALGICVMLFLIYMLIDYVYAGIVRVKKARIRANAQFAEENGEELLPLENLGCILKESLFRPEGWMPVSLASCIGLGILLGAASFFNGACVIACLGVLFVLALVSDHRMEYAFIAMITVLMTLLQSGFFIDGSVVQAKYFFGFLAANKTFFGAWDYLSTMCGILPILALAGFLLSDGPRKWIMFAFTTPIIVAFTLSLTIDITVNHKYVMLGVMLLSIYAAIFVNWLWHQKGICVKFVSLFLVVTMTITGLYDLTLVIKKNDSNKGYCMVFDPEDPRTVWVRDNATSKDIFLSSYYSLHPVVLGGAMLYYGWPYYAWSAGYDTDTRNQKVWDMYMASTSERLDLLVKEENIRYIIVDDDVRNSSEYEVNEENIRATYQCVFTSGTTDIYDTTIRLR